MQGISCRGIRCGLSLIKVGGMYHLIYINLTAVFFMVESCENGFFEDTTGWKPAWSNDLEEIKAQSKKGTYSWGVEEIYDGYWYLFLNISGIWAGR